MKAKFDFWESLNRSEVNQKLQIIISKKRKTIWGQDIQARDRNELSSMHALK